MGDAAFLLATSRIATLPNEGKGGFRVTPPPNLEVLAGQLVVLCKESLDLVQHAGPKVG